MLAIRIIQFISFRCRIFSTLFLLLIFALTPIQAWAGCTMNANGESKSFSSRRACEKEKRRLEHGCRRLRIKCPRYTCSCSKSGGSRSSTGSGLSLKREIGTAVGQAIGQMILDELFSNSPRRDVYAEQQAELERQRRRVAECETRKARSIAFDQDKADALSQMKDLDNEEFGLKGYDGGLSDMDFKTYHTDESIRRDILDGIRGKKEHEELYGWCVLHTPLRPTEPIYDGINCDYEIRLERFYDRRIKWEAKCDQGGEELTFKPMETETETPDKPKKENGTKKEKTSEAIGMNTPYYSKENGTKKEETSKAIGINTPYYSKENGTKKEETSKEETPLMKAIKCSDCSIIHLNAGAARNDIKWVNKINREFELCKEQLCYRKKRKKR